MDSYDSLNPMQREAVLHSDGPLLILAGAGSGKTRALTYRVAHLIEEGVKPWNILAITFTNKAAGEMRERVNDLAEHGDSVWVSTFHSLCVRILRRFIENLGYTTSFSIYDADDQRALMKQIIKLMNLDSKQYRERGVLGIISSAKNEMITAAEFMDTAKSAGDLRGQRLGEIYIEYEKQLKKNNALDFDDLLVKTVELFEKREDILASYQDRFRYIMVDEYQDTNTVQFKLVSLLAARYRNICVVGDDDQSIYRFRGANIRNILSFEKTFTGARVIKLEQNYRSTKTILDAANGVIRYNTGRKDKTLWTENEAGEPVRLRVFDNAVDEADGIIRDITKNGGPWKDYAVLYRTNAQSRLLEERCIAYNVPYRLVGGVNFYQRKEIKDVLAYLKTIANGRDDLAVQRIINVPKRGIGAVTINKINLFAAERGMNFYDALVRIAAVPGVGKAAAKIDKFTALIEGFRREVQEALPVREIIEHILNTTGYADELEEEGEEEAKARRENIDELMNKAAAYWEDAEEPTLDGFLEEVALVADIDSMDGSEDRVILMTLHAAKGLEFPYVYLSGMEDGLFPSSMSMSEDEEALEEERRLCYVGITRAKKRLMFTAARQRMVKGETRFSRISRFIGEVPQELMEEESAYGVSNAVQKQKRYEFEENGSLREHSEGISMFGTKPGTYDRVAFGNHMEKAGHAKADGSMAGHSYSVTGRPGSGAFPAGGRSPYASPSGAKSFKAPAFGKSFSVQKAESLDYAEGDRVRHTRFGDGTVRTIVDGGKDYEVTVEFDRIGVRKMFASFAALEKL